MTVPLKGETSGVLTVALKQFGVKEPDELPVVAYAEAAKLDSFKINAGDEQGVLTGSRLDEVSSFELKGIRFTPGKLSRAGQKDELRLAASNSAANSLQPEEKLTGHVDLKDGRVLDLQATVEAPRPKVDLLSKSVQPGATHSPVHLTNQDELPQDGRMSFFLKTEIPQSFPRTEKIEVANADSSFDVLLSVADGNLILQIPKRCLRSWIHRKALGHRRLGRYGSVPSMRMVGKEIGSRLQTWCASLH